MKPCVLFSDKAFENTFQNLLQTLPPEPEHENRRGRKPQDRKLLLSIIVEKLKTGKPWSAYGGRGNAANSLFQGLSDEGHLQALWWIISRAPEAYGFCPKVLWAATTWLIKENHINGPAQNWLGEAFVLPKPLKPEVYGPKQEKPCLPAIWKCDDNLWRRIKPFIEEAFPENSKGRTRIPMRRVINALIYQVRTGVQWKALPREFGHYSTIHRWKTRFEEAGVFDRIMAILLAEADTMNLIDWSVQALDCSYAKARNGGDERGQNPVDRAKSGTKRSILSDSTGLPLAIHIAGANIHDSQLVADTIARRVIHPTGITPTLLLDRGYRGATVKKVVESYGYEYKAPSLNKDNPYHILDEEFTMDDNRQRAAVEWTHAWHQQFRGVHTRTNTKASNYRANCVIASIVLIWTRITRRLN